MYFFKTAIILLLSIYTGVSLSACGENNANNGPQVANATESANGKKVYMQYCKNCHGASGDLKMNAAADLSESTLKKDSMIAVISEGRNTMQPFKRMLSEKEIAAVAEYVMKFRN